MGRKPYPEDYGAIAQFNEIIRKMWPFANCAVITGYELGLSALLKRGSDVWLNNPRMYREASGTSGMTAAMNGSVNLSLPDGWVPEFAKDKQNCFVIPPAGDSIPNDQKDIKEAENLMDIIENIIRPMYYKDQKKWLSIVKKAAARYPRLLTRAGWPMSITASCITHKKSPLFSGLFYKFYRFVL